MSKCAEAEKVLKSGANILSTMKSAHKKFMNNQLPLELLSNALCPNSNTNNILYSNMLGYNQNLNIMYNGN